MAYRAQGQITTPADRTSNVRLDNSGDMALMKQQAGIGNAILAGANMFVDQMQSADIMKASNMYNDKMSALRSELMQNKEENAMENMAKYEEGRQKILDDIYKNGPRFVRGGQGRQKFENSIERDWIGQKNQMRSYMAQEGEKYQDNQLANSLFRYNQNIADGWNNGMVLKDNIQQGEDAIRKRYQFHGEEKINSVINQWKGQAYGNAINMSMANDDWTAAGAMLQEYGQYLSPSDRLKMSKAITERKKEDIKISKFQEYANKWGHNVEGAVADFRTKNSSGVNVQKGMDFWNGIIGTFRGSNQCANTVSDYITAAGGDQKLISPLADGMQYNAEQNNLAFTDRNQLKDGDIVFWATGNWEASEDPAAVNNGKHDAYHGTDHVGVYNAKTGKVVQSGEHGVSEIDLDYYKVTGYAHPGGRQKTASELYKEEQELRTFMTGKIRQERQQEDINFTDSMKNIAGLKASNVSYDDAMKQALNAAGADPTKISNARSAVNAVYHDEFVKRGNGKSMDLGMQYNIENALRIGGFKNKKQLSEYLQRPEVHASAEQYTKIMRMYDDAQAGKGIFKIDKTAVLKEALGDQKLKGKEKIDAEIAAWAGVLDYVEQQRSEKHRDPSDNVMELAEAGRKAMTKAYYGHEKNGKWFGMADKKIDIAPGLLSAAGIDNRRTYQIDGTNDYVVSFKDGRKPRRMSVVELYNEAYKER